MTLVIRWSSYSFPIAQEQGNWKWPPAYEIPKASSHSMLVFWGVIPLLPTLWFNIEYPNPSFCSPNTLLNNNTQRSISYQMHFANLNHAFTARRCSVARSLAKTTFCDQSLQDNESTWWVWELPPGKKKKKTLGKKVTWNELSSGNYPPVKKKNIQGQFNIDMLVYRSVGLWRITQCPNRQESRNLRRIRGRQTDSHLDDPWG